MIWLIDIDGLVKIDTPAKNISENKRKVDETYKTSEHFALRCFGN